MRSNALSTRRRGLYIVIGDGVRPVMDLEGFPWTGLDLEKIQDEDTSPFEITSEITIEVEEAEEHSLGDLGEATSYKAAMLDPESKKIDYEETFSLVDDIRAITILISIAAFYDYEIWQMDVKTAFLYEAELRVDCYCDAGFETDKDDIKSLTGYVFVMNGGAVDLKSSKQSTNAMSATEAKYIATLDPAMKAVWIMKFILWLGIVLTINEPIKMYCDNSVALLIANEPGVQKGAIHYHRRYHYVRECIELGEINLLKVHIDNNLADPFMKVLPKGKLTQHARSIGLCLAGSFI
ncbi:putative retrotransposon protein [Tanacetum coccineum]